MDIHKKLRISIDGKIYEVDASVKSATPDSTSVIVTVGDKTFEADVREDRVRSLVKIPDVSPSKTEIGSTPVSPEKVQSVSPAASSVGELVRSPLPGKILTVKVKVGDEVKRGDLLLVLESMKMENEICSSRDGTIVELRALPGMNVETGELLLTIS